MIVQAEGPNGPRYGQILARARKEADHHQPTGRRRKTSSGHFANLKNDFILISIKGQGKAILSRIETVFF
jgi:hypothetical protein